MTGKTTQMVYHLWIIDEETDCRSYIGQFDNGQAALDAVPEDSVYEILEAPVDAAMDEWKAYMAHENMEGY